jgi:hypothetical protein
LPNRLGGFSATSELTEYSNNSLGEMVNDRGASVREYHVQSAATRSYGAVRVEVFQTANEFSAFGLFSFLARAMEATRDEKSIGSDSASAPNETAFWKDKFVVRVLSSKPDAKVSGGQLAAVASSVSASLPAVVEVNRPPLLGNVPGSPVRSTYILGPESLSVFVPRGGEMFAFDGRAEAVLAEYAQTGSTPTPVTGKADQPANLKLIILECHTPHFATDAYTKARDFLESLPESDRERVILKREGNYILQAMGFENRDSAEQLVDSVKYPYTVKWLRNPLWPTNDPFRTQKAAQMLISTFGLLGLIMLSVLVVGGGVGAVIFLKRRRRQLQVFSDAGGMLRLDLDPYDEVILGLPPARRDD